MDSTTKPKPPSPPNTPADNALYALETALDLGECVLLPHASVSLIRAALGQPALSPLRLGFYVLDGAGRRVSLEDALTALGLMADGK